ncbi:MAG TPA: ACT domain-containing protein [Spirochaetota bacterium]|nr:ACT domain-containing protein [Spirochaetota bacterium]HNT11140.1 ACT domain-containing protein [Spirochaetota bacterium]HNV48631.1 ACT domain-containing protein [Spirochaetota bacterium]HOS39753.1 ACT domain-containing protein [Spirochaetota bacterium]HPI23471.1 ACT domain-containing protein [Spirochaetota bacterium]
MRSYLVFSSMGPDRPGLADAIAEFFTARGINIERSRGSVLGNEFGMIILTSGKTDSIDSLIGDLDSLRASTGLDIHVRRTKAPAQRESQPSIPYRLVATSIDHPGIVHQICKVLRERAINIDDMESNVDYNPFTGANIFHMICHFSLPPTVKIVDLRSDLLRISDQFNIDIRFDAVVSK